jgi:hypothetical protein
MQVKLLILLQDFVRVGETLASHHPIQLIIPDFIIKQFTVSSLKSFEHGSEIGAIITEFTVCNDPLMKILTLSNESANIVAKLLEMQGV